MSTLQTLKRKLDLIACDQLRSAASDLYTELEQTKTALNRATEDADYWREQVFSLQEQLSQNQTLGMTIEGSLHVMQNTH